MPELDFVQVGVAMLATLLIGLVKGAFGGGFGLVGIPLLSLVMDPITAGAIMAPLFIPMDILALRYYPPKTWSLPDLKILIPTMIAGIGLGTIVLTLLDARLAAIAIAVTTLAFAAIWYAGGQRTANHPRNHWLAAIAGTASGIATMVVHSGTPPLAVYLLRLGLAKDLYVGTTTIYFAVGNTVKVWPWLLIARPSAAVWATIMLCVPVAVIGVWIGWLLHKKLDQRRLYQACYALLVITSLKLLWDGVRGYL